MTSNGSFFPQFLRERFKNVQFNYPSRPDVNVFDGFNLSIRKGEIIALVGKGGSGKSTGISLLERFYDPKAGSIEYCGSDIKALNIQ